MSPRHLVLLVSGVLVAAPAFGQVIDEEHSESVVPGVKAGKLAQAPDLAEAARLIFERVNQFRQQERRTKLALNPKLSETAQAFAEYMAKTNRFSHTADGNRPANRARAHGYDYCIIAENIAYQYSSGGFTPQELARGFFDSWVNSPEHKKNMLDPDVTETGIGVARSDDTGYYYAVQLFGRPRSRSVRFQIANRSDATVDYKIGNRTYHLPPRYTMTHEQCRPGPVQFRWPDAAGQEPESVTPDNRAKYVIVRDQDGHFAVENE